MGLTLGLSIPGFSHRQMFSQKETLFWAVTNLP
jgi:hypothetical protein